MRLIKEDHEMNLMKKAADITTEAHIRAMQAVTPGMYEYQLEAEYLYAFNKNGARSPAYNSIVGEAIIPAYFTTLRTMLY